MKNLGGFFGLTIVVGVVVGCGPHFGARTPGEANVLHALLINGGGNPRINYVSHTRHLLGMQEVLLGHGVQGARIKILSADGENLRPDIAVKLPNDAPEGWLIEGASIERALHPLRFIEADFGDKTRYRASADELRYWISAGAEELKPGDNLLLFVTDHGSKGGKPEENQITLWNNQGFSARELRDAVGHVPSGVRTVMLMAQCFSGGFAEVALQPASAPRKMGDSCGYFSTTADREAYGCSPDADDRRDDGYATRFIAGLQHRGGLRAAHAEALITDRSADVPVRSSDIFLERFVAGVAAKRQRSTDELLETLLGEASSNGGDDLRLVEQVAAAFALPLPGRGTTWKQLSERVSALSHAASDSSERWQQALEDLTHTNLESFLANEASWTGRLDRRSLRFASLEDLASLRGKFLADLGRFSRTRTARWERLNFGHTRAAFAEALAARSRTRIAAIMRLRVLTTSLVGGHLIATEGSAQERADLAALKSCEDLALPAANQPGGPIEMPPALPSLDADERLAKELAPSVLGARFVEASPEQRRQGNLPAGAVRLTIIEANSPAAAAALRTGDILLGEAGAPEADAGAMKLMLASQTPNRQVLLEISREGARLKVPLTLQPAQNDLGDREPSAAVRAGLRSLKVIRGQVAQTLASTKPRLLFFWTTWCQPCKRAIPALLELERKGQVDVVAISNENSDTVKGFVDRADAFPQLVAVDPDGAAVVDALGIDTFPTFIWIDELGRIEGGTSGYDPELDLARPPKEDECKR